MTTSATTQDHELRRLIRDMRAAAYSAGMCEATESAPGSHRKAHQDYHIAVAAVCDALDARGL